MNPGPSLFLCQQRGFSSFLPQLLQARGSTRALACSVRLALLSEEEPRAMDKGGGAGEGEFERRVMYRYG